MSNLSTFLQVYRGILPAGQLIAIKRAHTESMQGGVEFKTEIELLSRVHHKNLVSLVGFCFDQGGWPFRYFHSILDLLLSN
jgi:serine/threonine protein kinase